MRNLYYIHVNHGVELPVTMQDLKDGLFHYAGVNQMIYAEFEDHILGQQKMTHTCRVMDQNVTIRQAGI